MMPILSGGQLRSINVQEKKAGSETRMVQTYVWWKWLHWSGPALKTITICNLWWNARHEKGAGNSISFTAYIQQDHELVFNLNFLIRYIEWSHFEGRGPVEWPFIKFLFGDIFIDALILNWKPNQIFTLDYLIQNLQGGRPVP